MYTPDEEHSETDGEREIVRGRKRGRGRARRQTDSPIEGKHTHNTSLVIIHCYY